jgi:uncharacterized protein (TIGR02271 family)
MAQVIVGLYDQHADAQAAYDELISAGVERGSIDMVSSASDTSLIDRLPDSVPQRDKQFYREGLRQGGALLVVRVADTLADQACDIMEGHNLVDLNERMRSSSFASSELSQSELRAGGVEHDDVVLPVVEEDLQIGKRQVERGRMRVYTRVEERPVEEQVTLRDETVHVERRPVNRELDPADLNAFQNQEFELTETDEEAVVAKRARVVEEVVLHKDVEEHTETIRDTVRRTDVQVEQTNSERAVGHTEMSGYDSYDNDFRTYFNSNMSNSGYTYEQYSPVFRYGHNLASDQRYSGDWSTVEADAHRYWEEQNPGTWEQVKDSVRYAWEKARGRR